MWARSMLVTKARQQIFQSRFVTLNGGQVVEGNVGESRGVFLFQNTRLNSLSKRFVTSSIRRMLVGSATDTSASNRGTESNFRAPVLNQEMTLTDALPVVILAGAAGQLGRKIYQRLLHTTAAEYVDLPLSSRPIDATYDSQGSAPARFKIILMDSKPCPQDLDLHDVKGHEVEYVQCDFSTLDDAWAKKFSKAYVAFLLATKVHFPSATSDEAYDSMVINANLLEACIKGRVERVVLGSSTDVVRGKVQEEAEKHTNSNVKSEPVRENTQEEAKKQASNTSVIDAEAHPQIPNSSTICGTEFDSRLYAAAKAAAEAQAHAVVAAGHLKRVIILRLGAAYPIENIAVNNTAKARLAGGDIGTISQGDDYLLDWFKQVELKDADLDNIIDCCISPGLESTPEHKKVITVNAVSANHKSKLQTKNYDFGYVPPHQSDIPGSTQPHTTPGS